jgi:AhpC/TSA family
MIPGLRQRIEAFQRDFFPKVPKEVVDTLVKGIENMVVSGVGHESVKLGDRAPDFRLPNASGEPVALASLLARGPAVVAFYRGVW